MKKINYQKIIIAIVSLLASILISKIGNINIQDFDLLKDLPSDMLDDPSDFFDNLNNSLGNSDDSPSEPSDFEEKNPDEFTVYYDQLSDLQKKIYTAMGQAVSSADKKFTLSNVSVSDFERECKNAAVAFQYDHPEYFWFTAGYSFDYDFYQFSSITSISPTIY